MHPNNFPQEPEVPKPQEDRSSERVEEAQPSVTSHQASQPCGEGQGEPEPSPTPPKEQPPSPSQESQVQGEGPSPQQEPPRIGETRTPPPPPSGPPRQPRPDHRPIIIGAILGCGPWFLLFLILSFWLGSRAVPKKTLISKEKVGLIYISGIIAGEEISPFGGIAGAQSIIEQLREAGKDSSIKALVLRVNSPGGSAPAAQELYKEIIRFKKKYRKKVVVSMGDMAASGGFYLASAADKIIANESTLTGSIGVIMELPQWEGLMKKLGIGIITIKSGRYKDIGSPTRPMSTEEKALLQQLVMDVYEQFITAVAEGRKIPKSRVRALADGRIFTGRQALKLGLVDQIGTLQDAIALAGKLGGISGEPAIQVMGKKTFLDLLLGDTQAYIHPQGLRPVGLLLDPRLLPLFQQLPLSPTGATGFWSWKR